VGVVVVDVIAAMFAVGYHGDDVAVVVVVVDTGCQATHTGCHGAHGDAYGQVGWQDGARLPVVSSSGCPRDSDLPEPLVVTWRLHKMDGGHSILPLHRQT